MITRVLVLAMMSAMTFVVATPAFSHDYFEVSEDGALFEGGDIGWGKCSKLTPEFFTSEEDFQEAARACEKAGFPVKGSPTQTPLPDTGGPPLTLVPIALLVVGGLLLFRKSTAL